MIISTAHKNLSKMIKMILTMFGFHRKVIQIWLHDMFNVVESIEHGSLESGTNIFKTKRQFSISKSTPRTDERSFLLIFWENFNLIVSGETIHKGKNFTTGTIINDLVDKSGRVIVLRTCLIKIPIINTNLDSTSFLSNGHGIGNPFHQRYRINKTNFQQFLYLCLDCRSFLWMNWLESLSNRLSSRVGLNFVNHNTGFDSRHFFLRPRKNIIELFKEGGV